MLGKKKNLERTKTHQISPPRAGYVMSMVTIWKMKKKKNPDRVMVGLYYIWIP